MGFPADARDHALFSTVQQMAVTSPLIMNRGRGAAVRFWARYVDKIAAQRRIT